MADFDPRLRAAIRQYVEDEIRGGVPPEQVERNLPAIESALKQRLIATSPTPPRTDYMRPSFDPAQALPDEIDPAAAPGTNPKRVTMQEPRRPVERSALDNATAFAQEGVRTVSFGTYPMLTDALGLSSPESREQVRQQAPVAADLGAGTGYAVSAIAGPAALTQRAVTGTVAALSPQLAAGGRAALLGRVGANAATGAAIGAAETGTMEGTASGAGIGALATAAGEAAGAGARKVAEVIKDPRRLSGEYARALERGQGPIQATYKLDPRTGELVPDKVTRAPGYLQSEEFHGLKKGIRGIGEQADISGEALGDLQAGRLAGARSTLRAREDALPGLDETMPVQNLHADLRESVRRYSGGNATRPDVARTVEGVVDDLSRARVSAVETPEAALNAVRGQPTPSRTARNLPPGRVTPSELERMRRLGDVQGRVRGSYEISPSAEVPVATGRDVLTARRAVRDQAEHGLPSTPENAPYREIYSDLRTASQRAIPGLKAMDNEFAGAMQKLSEGNELIFGRENARAVTDSLAARKAAASRLTQALKDTQAGGANARLLEDIRALGPEYAQAVDKVAAKIAFEGTRFGLTPNVFSHSGKWVLQPVIQNAEAAAVRAALPMAEGLAVAAPAAGRVSARSMNPIQRSFEAQSNRKQTEQRELSEKVKARRGRKD